MRPKERSAQERRGFPVPEEGGWGLPLGVRKKKGRLTNEGAESLSFVNYSVFGESLKRGKEFGESKKRQLELKPRQENEERRTGTALHCSTRGVLKKNPKRRGKNGPH